MDLEEKDFENIKLEIVVDKSEIDTPDFFNRITEAMGHEIPKDYEIKSKDDYFNMIGFLMSRLIDRPLISPSLSSKESILADYLFKLNVIEKERKRVRYKIRASDESKGFGFTDFTEYTINPEKLELVESMVETFNQWINAHEDFEEDLEKRIYDLGVRHVPY